MMRLQPIRVQKLKHDFNNNILFHYNQQFYLIILVRRGARSAPRLIWDTALKHDLSKRDRFYKVA